jgi:hypothetical protein
MALLAKKRKQPTKAMKKVFGEDVKLDDNGRPIEQGIGSKGNESLSHYAALAQTLGLKQKYHPSEENLAAYNEAVKVFEAAKVEALESDPEDDTDAETDLSDL